ncbi:hypothetical protein MEQU1_000582 [Malassezia equina]|uniref:DNA mismatch repair proteins mutS family domain-containing protein n=1 Tax=Malassezia equina TaxID=1381935 RepID=A0AAF0IYZ0_9BASI|nr:hypothetical protein MEQU1_000582 [Malassezia equina]
MAGFPIHQLDKYLKVLVQEHGKLVAICDEFKTDVKNLPFQRRVTRVVSPGTLIDERFLDPFHNNFILAITESEEGKFGLAWLDVSTADFQTSECADAKSVRDEIARIAPREVVLVHDNIYPPEHPISEAIRRIQAVNSQISMPEEITNSLGVEETNVSAAEFSAINLLTGYLSTRLLEHMPDMHVDAPQHTDKTMHMDAATLAALEIRETNERSTRGSLVNILRRTVTQGGARLFVHWLTAPSTSIPLIRARQSIVDLFLHRSFLHQDIRMIMHTSIGDVLRTLQRISLRRNDVQDLLEIRDFIQAMDQILDRLKSETSAPVSGSELNEWMLRCTSLHELGERLGEAIDERVMQKRMEQQAALSKQFDSLYDTGEATTETVDVPKVRKQRRVPVSMPLLLEEPLWGDDIEHLIRPDSSPLLRTLTDQYNECRAKARILENSLRQRHEEHVTLKFLLGQGYIVHFPSPRSTALDESLTLAYKTKTTRTFYHPEWSKIGMKLQKLRDQITECESRLLDTLRLEVLVHSSTLRRNARLLDQLDVLQSFAQAAKDLSLVRPHVDESYELDICDGRHLGVELGLMEQERLFTKNDLELGQNARLHLITGPNMGGKSTFLRQNAIIAVLAQAGSFVPAGAARIGVVDAIFSRVGAKDDLFHNRSTFMVEMSETADILQRASSRSFVIADEIGRGTNTSVGLAVAFSVLHSLAARIQCRTLFATHYYELADMLGFGQDQPPSPNLSQQVAFFCTNLVKHGEVLWFSHRVRPGVNRDSHGLVVARLAGMPEDTMELATKTHAWIVQHGRAHIDTHGLVQDVLKPQP